MLQRLLRGALLALAFAAALPSHAGAATYLFTISGNASATFSLGSSPTPTLSGSNGFEIDGVTGTYNGSPTTFDLLFFTSADDGGLDVNSAGSGSLLSLSGPELFTGTTANPTFVLGTFPLSTFGSNDLLYSLTISEAPTGAVPEPGSWALLLLGFGAIGVAMRRRRAAVIA
jgi:hypothetical protein